MYSSITNVVKNDTVVQEMTALYNEAYPDMKFVTMDLLEKRFKSESFTCFVDNGTLDELVSDSDIESKERADKLFGV